jgi:type II secretory pathway pseudopilin PulG
MTRISGSLRAACGFSYIGLLLLIAIMGAGLAGAAVYYHQQVMREKETELLFVGDQMRKAISHFHDGSPDGEKRFPRNLEELLDDKRFAVPRRHLRQIYRDPMTNSTDWGLVKNERDEIVGVHSLSGRAPIKVSNFRDSDAEFEGAASYADWKFVPVVIDNKLEEKQPEDGSSGSPGMPPSSSSPVVTPAVAEPSPRPSADDPARN